MSMKQKKAFSIPGLIILIIFFAGSIVTLVFAKQVFGAESLFDAASPNYLFAELNDTVQGMVQKIPALLRSVITITFAITVYKMVKIVSSALFQNNNRMLTISSLLLSLLKWIIAIAVLLMVLSTFGVDTGVLLASAGILTLVVGLGAQSLIADILAGFFLVFEGEYQVGDIISIDGWRGTVKDIGIRVTRIEDAGGNIKTINNGDVKNVVNQTNELSVAKVYLPIDYDESLERVETVLRDNFKAIEETIPGIVEGPYYKGVSELGESSVNLLIIAKCKENDIYQVQRDLTRELYIIFNKNNITVPFKQVVISQREETSKKVSKKIEKEADKFVEEQKELSKNIEEQINQQ